VFSILFSRGSKKISPQLILCWSRWHFLKNDLFCGDEIDFSTMLVQGNSKKNNPDSKIAGIFPAKIAADYGDIS
jgi:hypothetical protein